MDVGLKKLRRFVTSGWENVGQWAVIKQVSNSFPRRGALKPNLIYPWIDSCIFFLSKRREFSGNFCEAMERKREAQPLIPIGT